MKIIIAAVVGFAAGYLFVPALTALQDAALMGSIRLFG